MDLQISGKVIEVLDEQSGEGKNGPWRKQDFILETGGKYPKKICITQWGESIDQHNVAENDELTAHIDIQSREYKGRWYTDVKAWKIEKGSNTAPKNRPETTAGPVNLSGNADEDDGLPF